MQEHKSGNQHYTPKILVVDDEMRIREGCQEILNQEGFEVSTADSGKKGLEMIAREHFDIVLLDLMMPEISGLDVLPEVKSSHPDTVVIVITGYATIEHSIEAMKAGAFDFIPKPFSPEQLKVVVSKAIEYTRALQDIAKEKSRRRGLINRLSDGVMATDDQERVVLANPAFMKMINFRGEKVIGHTVKSFINKPKLLDMIDKALSMPLDKFVELIEEIHFGGNGDMEETVLNAHCTPFRDRTGLNLGTITVLHDITALKKIDRMKSDFVSMVSHEIRSPMNSVLMQLKVILDGLAGEVSEKQAEILNRASKKINSLVEMASELLDLAKIESGLITLEKEAVQFNELLEEQCVFQQESAAAKNITIHFETTSDLPPVSANRQNMEEVISNLITNAIQYSPDGGTIDLAVTLENGYLCIHVKDTGLGMPAEDLERIFDRFYRVKNERTRYITGTGLGLPIVKKIIQAHHGTIRVESVEGQGSVFRVYIPHLTE
ncbi:MAG: response regulator [Deltaproteobacteria bacterium]|nr:response regulator [Deltaproteobacteria bacterium]